MRGHVNERPKGELVIQTIAMPKDTNANGDIFAGTYFGNGVFRSTDDGGTWLEKTTG